MAADEARAASREAAKAARQGAGGSGAHDAPFSRRCPMTRRAIAAAALAVAITRGGSAAQATRYVQDVAAARSPSDRHSPGAPDARHAPGGSTPDFN